MLQRCDRADRSGSPGGGYSLGDITTGDGAGSLQARGIVAKQGVIAGWRWLPWPCLLDRAPLRRPGRMKTPSLRAARRLYRGSGARHPDGRARGALPPAPLRDRHPRGGLSTWSRARAPPSWTRENGAGPAPAGEVPCAPTRNRYALDDAILIKDNHIAAAGGITEAVRRARARGGHTVVIEVETQSREQVEEALAAGAGIIMFDNMTPEEMRECVALVGGRALTEASGGISEATARAAAETRVDLISVGALTHSAPALDLSLKICAAA